MSLILFLNQDSGITMLGVTVALSLVLPEFLVRNHHQPTWRDNTEYRVTFGRIHYVGSTHFQWIAGN